MSPKALPAWERLTEAMQHTEPDCADDERYITDNLATEEKDELGAICAACPLVTFCTDYAITDKLRGAWWPGVNLKPIDRKAAA